MKTQRLGRFAEATLELPHWVLLLAGGMVALGAATGLAGVLLASKWEKRRLKLCEGFVLPGLTERR
jgi:hypothetical protein